MIGSPQSVENFYSKISGAKLYDSQGGFYSFPCAQVPKVSFNWGGRNWDIDSSLYVNHITLPLSFSRHC